MQIIAQHILIAAIKYLDGSPAGEGVESVVRAKIRIMLSKLPEPTVKALERERADFWE